LIEELDIYVNESFRFHLANGATAESAKEILRFTLQ
jgi:hypothetical protein